MAKKKEKKLISFKMEIKNMKLILKMTNKMESELISMKVDPKKMNFT
jgi:hypothetical protein